MNNNFLAEFPDHCVLGIDQDEHSLAAIRQNFGKEYIESKRLELKHGKFSRIKTFLNESSHLACPQRQVGMVLFDLGYSNAQVSIEVSRIFIKLGG